MCSELFLPSRKREGVIGTYYLLRNPYFSLHYTPKPDKIPLEFYDYSLLSATHLKMGTP